MPFRPDSKIRSLENGQTLPERTGNACPSRQEENANIYIFHFERTHNEISFEIQNVMPTAQMES